MYYGFEKETKMCIWSIDTMPGVPEGMVVLKGADGLDIRELRLGQDGDEYVITEYVKTEEDLLNEAKSLQSHYMQTAKTQIDTLNDVVEFTPSDEAEAKLAEWRKYRADLYNMDFTSMESLVWPKSPDAED